MPRKLPKNWQLIKMTEKDAKWTTFPLIYTTTIGCTVACFCTHVQKYQHSREKLYRIAAQTYVCLLPPKFGKCSVSSAVHRWCGEVQCATKYRQTPLRGLSVPYCPNVPQFQPVSPMSHVTEIYFAKL